MTKLIESSYILNVNDNFANLKFDGNELNLPISNILVDINLQEPSCGIDITNTQFIMTNETIKKTTITLEIFEKIKVTSNNNGKFKFEVDC